MFAVAALGCATVVALTLLSAWPPVSDTARTAIGAVGTMVAAVLAAVAVKS